VESEMVESEMVIPGHRKKSKNMLNNLFIFSFLAETRKRQNAAGTGSGDRGAERTTSRRTSKK